MKTLLPLTLAALLLAGCSDADPDTASETVFEPATAELSEAGEAGVVEIVWDDLMPEGELQRLEELYADFYDELEDDIANSQTLMDAANGQDPEADIAAMIAEGSANDTMEQIGTFNVVEDLDGLTVRLPGYVVPFDFSADAEYSEFLLVPYFGACLHTPPPPPNQMLFVRAAKPAKIESIYDPVWIEGRISTGKFESDLGNSAYELALSSVEPYQ